MSVLDQYRVVRGEIERHALADLRHPALMGGDHAQRVALRVELQVRQLPCQ